MWGLGRCGVGSTLAVRKGLISKLSLEPALVDEQKCCCPQRHHLCDLWPQEHFSQRGLKGKETKWCKKNPTQILFVHPGVRSVGFQPWSCHCHCHQPGHKGCSCVQHHLCPCSCLPAALLWVSVDVALQQPAAFVSFFMLLLSAWWPVVCVVCFREVYFEEIGSLFLLSGYCCGQ